MGTDLILTKTLEILVVLFIVQGLKSIGMPGDRTAKVVAILVGALFLAANELIALFVPTAMIPALKAVVVALEAVLMLFAPPGVYSSLQLFAKRLTAFRL